MRLHPLRTWLAAVFCTVLAACGGGDSANQTEVVATGAITGFGSVYVNGVHFETDGARITRDGASASQGDLRVGQIVHVHGNVDKRSGRAIANWIRQHDNLEGPISAVNATAQTFVVLGHTVVVNAETSFDNSLGDFSALVVGLQVEVNGMPDATGSIIATRVEKRRGGETQLEVVGKVSALDTVAKRFNLNALVVDYSGATLEDFEGAVLANDQVVEVKGASLNGAGALVASVVELHDFERGLDRDCERGLQGLVTRFVSATDFDVSGRKVTTTSSTVYEGGVAADLVLNAKVEVEGTVDANGVLVASKIKFKRSNAAGIAGLVQAATADATGNGGTLTVMGVTITVDAKTRIEDKGDSRIEMFGVKDLRVGDYVEVRGQETAVLKLTASRLERRRVRTDVWVRGTVRDLLPPAFTALGVAVTTNSSTDFEDGGSTQFFANAAGRVVKVKGTLTGTTITAREVEFEDHEDDGDHRGGDDHGPGDDD
jgi:hypothetical protein